MNSYGNRTSQFGQVHQTENAEMTEVKTPSRWTRPYGFLGNLEVTLSGKRNGTLCGIVARLSVNFVY